MNNAYRQGGYRRFQTYQSKHDGAWPGTKANHLKPWTLAETINSGDNMQSCIVFVDNIFFLFSLIGFDSWTQSTLLLDKHQLP